MPVENSVSSQMASSATELKTQIPRGFAELRDTGFSHAKQWRMAVSRARQRPKRRNFFRRTITASHGIQAARRS